MSAASILLMYQHCANPDARPHKLCDSCGAAGSFAISCSTSSGFPGGVVWLPWGVVSSTCPSHATSIAIIHKANTFWYERVKEHTAHATHLHRRGSTITTNTFLRLAVSATPRIVIIMPQKANIAALTPASAPGILNEPVLFEGAGKAIIFSVPFREHRMAKSCILAAVIENTMRVVKPIVRIHRHDHCTLSDKSLLETVCLVARQRIPAVEGHPLPGRVAWGARLQRARRRLLLLSSERAGFP